LGDDLQVGQAVTIRRAFSQRDFDRFAALTGDDNPIHVDPQFSARTKFGGTVAHGMLLYSVVCGVLGSRLPGPGTVQMEQDLMFPSATFVGEEVAVGVQVTELRSAQGLAALTTVVTRPDGDRGLQGQTLVRLPGAPAITTAPVSDTALPGGGSGNEPLPYLKGLEIGQCAETRRAFTGPDLAEYANLTGDTNPVFTDAGYARGLGLSAPLIPGGLLAGLFSYLLGTRLPGRGTNYLKQRLLFPVPACPDQELVATVEVVRIRPEKQLVNLRTTCTNPLGEPVCQGEALVLVSDMVGSA
jgi:acyl dehydratase